MTNTIRSSVSVHALIGLGLVVMALVIMSFPSFANAATYGFVNRAGYVSTINADSSASALIGALNLSINSGVMLFDSIADNALLGFKISWM